MHGGKISVWLLYNHRRQPPVLAPFRQDMLAKTKPALLPDTTRYQAGPTSLAYWLWMHGC